MLTPIEIMIRVHTLCDPVAASVSVDAPKTCPPVDAPSTFPVEEVEELDRPSLLPSLSPSPGPPPFDGGDVGIGVSDGVGVRH